MAGTPLDESTFPRQQARTRRFSLGRPRNIRVADDGTRVAFLRSRGGDDPITCLWVIDVAQSPGPSFRERLVADPRVLAADRSQDENLAPAERARRERVRESATGIVAYGADRLLRKAAFSISGELFVADLDGGEVHRLATAGPVVDPRVDPTGRRVAYVSGGTVHVVDEDGRDMVVAGEVTDESEADVGWGLAEFIAAEEMGRFHGYWWSPDGTSLAVTRVDTGPVARWHLTDPADPAVAPGVVSYPAAGTSNADVSLHLVTLAGARREVDWDRAAFPYLARVSWHADSPLTVLVQSRDQRHTRVLAVEPGTGATMLCRDDHDDTWVDLMGGVPRWTPAGELVTTAYVDDVMRVLVDGRPVTPADLQVRGVVDTEDGIVFSASADPSDVHVWHCPTDGSDAPRLLSPGPGLHRIAVGGDITVVASATLDAGGTRVTLRRGDELLGQIESFAEMPTVDPHPLFFRAGPRQIRCALLLPHQVDPGSRLPVLLDPYGGPGHQRVIHSRHAYLESQWLADQGFAVLVADGRGTGGRGRAWDRGVHLDLAEPVLEDQVDALHAAAAQHPQLDLERVAIRGWSFGGYLAALAVMRRPDVFHAAVAGAPVTDWQLYDTHYTERYLGHPDENADAYGRSSLMPDAAKLRRPLLLIHGISDDNVVFAHTIRLSRALFEAGRDHEVLPLSGITHMTPQEVVAENLLLLQVRFLKRALGMGGE